MKKKLAAFVLLLVFSAILFNYFLFLGFINSNKSAFRSEVLKTGLEQVKTREISLNSLYKDADGLIWRENNSELIVDGVYYEVIGIFEKGSTAVLSLIEDGKENDLFGSCFKNQKNNSDLMFQIVKLFLNMNFECSCFDDVKLDFSFKKFIPVNESIDDLLSDLRFLKPPSF